MWNPRYYAAPLPRHRAPGSTRVPICSGRLLRIAIHEIGSGSMRRSAPTSKQDKKSALLAGVAAFITWGLIPGYWKLMRAVPAKEILAHRYVWTFVFLTGLLTWQRRWGEVRANAGSARALAFCAVSGCT